MPHPSAIRKAGQEWFCDDPSITCDDPDILCDGAEFEVGGQVVRRRRGWARGEQRRIGDIQRVVKL